MTPVRRPRLFRDHKAPLAAFVLVAMTTMFMMVHIARSEAAPAWLRNGVSTIAAGPVFAQRVLTGDLVKPDPEPAEPPAVVTAADVVARTPEAPASPSATRTPDSTPAHAPDRGTRHHHPQQQPVKTDEPTQTPDPSTDPEPDYPSKDESEHGLSWGWGHDDDSDSDSGSDSGGSGHQSTGVSGHDWSHGLGEVLDHVLGHGNSDHDWGQGDSDHGWGHDSGSDHGSDHGWGHDSGDDHGWGHDDDHDGGWGHDSGHDSGHGGWGHRG